MFMKGLSSGKFRLELGQRWAESNVWLTEILRVNIILSSPWLGALVPAELKGTLLPDSVQEELRLSFITELLCDCPFSVPASLGFLTIMDH